MSAGNRLTILHVVQNKKTWVAASRRGWGPAGDATVEAAFCASPHIFTAHDLGQLFKNETLSKEKSSSDHLLDSHLKSRGRPSDLTSWWKQKETVMLTSVNAQRCTVVITGMGLQRALTRSAEHMWDAH